MLSRPDSIAMDALLDRIYRHYPRGIEADDPRHRASEETRRLVSVQEAAARSCQRSFYAIPDEDRVPIDADVQPVVDALRAWRSFAARWREHVPDIIISDDSNPWHEASYRYSALRPGYTPASNDWHDPVVCAVSVLTPVYVMYTYVPAPDASTQIRYADFPERYRDRLDRLGRLAEAMFGFSRLAGDLALASVPDVVPIASNRLIGEATVMDCLFSTSP